MGKYEKKFIDEAFLTNWIAPLGPNVENFEKEVSSAEIGKRVMALLRELDQVAYVRFASVYRQFADVDAFIDEIKTLK